MSKFRKLPVEVGAIQWMGNNADEVAEFFGQPGSHFGLKEGVWSVITPDGTKSAAIHDWIIKGAAGEFDVRPA